MTYLKKMREKMDFTQEDVAQAIGTTIRQYQRIEAGLSFCSREKLNKLEDFFQLPQRILFARNYEEIPSYYRGSLTVNIKHCSNERKGGFRWVVCITKQNQFL